MRIGLRLIVILFAVIFFFGCQSQTEKKEEFYKNANTYFNNKEYKKADIELRNALQIDPNFIQAYHLLAKNMTRLGNLKDAYRVYNKIIQINAEDIEANLKVAEFLLLGKKSEQAMEKIVFILEKDPKNVEALMVKGQIYIQKRLFQKAFKVYEAVLQIDNQNVSALQNMAKIHAINRQLDDAEKLLLKTVELKPKDLVVRLILVGFYLKQKQVDKVEAQLKEAIDNTPEKSEPYILLANLYFNKKNNPEAEKFYLKALLSKNGF